MLLTVVAALIIAQFLPLATSTLHTVLIGLLVAFGAIVGDLFESYLKRSLASRTAGNILPGHGGFADRFDSFLLGGAAVLLLFQHHAGLSRKERT